MRILDSTILVTLLLGITLMAAPCAHAAKPGSDPVVLSKNADMDFGALEFDVNHNGSLQLGTNGSLAVIGTGMVSNMASQPGIVSITAPATGIVEVKCTDLGKLKNGNLGLDLSNVEIAINTGLPFGSGSACLGNKGNSPPTAVIDLSSTPTPNILMGGQLVIPANSLAAGTYSTLSGGAQAITLTVVIQ